MSYIISKTNYISYLQCPSRLWLEKHIPEKAALPSSSQQYFIEEGERVEQLAKKTFPAGVIIPRDASITERLSLTNIAIDEKHNVIFEASFLVNKCFAAIDILQWTDNGWKVIEIKATNKIEKKHLRDVAFQCYVLNKAGMPIESVNIMHLDKDATWDSNIKKMFIVKNVTDDIQEYVKSIDSDISVAANMLVKEKNPDSSLCRNCFQDGGCLFKEYCWNDIKEPTIFDIPLHWKYRDTFTNQGILQLKDIPDNMELKEKIRLSVDRGKEQAIEINDQAVNDWVNSLSYPIYFLDFETYSPAIPLFSNMRPYQRIPFQFSCHVLHKNGEIKHTGFLHKHNSDPRRLFLNELKNILGKQGSIVVYHQSFEAGVLKELKEILKGEDDEELDDYIIRMADLETIFLKHYYHYAFKGSTSIKAVLPVLCPELTYDNLEIKKGDQASIAWLDIIDKNKNSVAADLEEYCKLDTYAMLAIYKKLASIPCSVNNSG